MSNDYDCLTCGACCASQSPGAGYVLLSAADIARLGGLSLPILESAEQDAELFQLNRQLGTRIDARGQKVCTALDGCAGGTNRCTIYEQRPDACRGFEVGGMLCRLAREAFGLPTSPTVEFEQS